MGLKKKLKKLWRHPHTFITDAINKRFGEKVAQSPERQPGLSLFVPVNGAAGGALQRFLRQIHLADVPELEQIEVLLLVAEGDQQALSAARTQSKSRVLTQILVYPGECFWDAIRQALPTCRGDWIGFSSVDVEFSKGYFSLLRREMARQYELSAIATELISGSKGRPLNARIRAPRKIRVPNPSLHAFLDPENIYLRKGMIGQAMAGERFSQLPKGSFLGLSLLYDYFASVGETSIKMLPQISKRMTGKQKGVEPFGLIGRQPASTFVANLLTLDQQCRHERQLPEWLQLRTAYALFQMVDYQAAKRGVLDDLPDTLQARFDTAIGNLLQRMSFDFLEDEGAGLGRWAVRFGLYYRYLGICPLVPPVFFDEFDNVSGLVRLRVIFPFDCALSYIRNGLPYTPPISRVTPQLLAGKPLLEEHIVWVSVLGLADLIVLSNGKPCPLYLKNKRIPTLSGALFDRYVQPPVFSFSESPRSFMLRYLALHGAGARRFRDCWLFIDKDSKADDNAEHYYRWVMHNAPEARRSYFILRRDSRDWKRLEEEGFKLLAFGSLEHKLALLNASWLFSSHAAPFVVNVLPRKYFADLLRYKFGFLQHGVTKDDQSSWLNSRQIDMLVTVAEAEKQSMSSGAYKYTEREVVLTGFPRYDALRLRRAESPKRLVIMPTWRLHLSGDLIGKTSQRAYNPAFAESDFCREWGALLSNEALMSRFTAAGFEVVFLAHPNIQPYLDLFHLAPSVRLADLENASIQDYLADCALLITDYSSVAFDVAYLRRPVLYFQFDFETFFASHTYGRGYYDYEEHGFGPVVYTGDKLTATLEEMAARQFALQDRYRQRIDGFFAFDDAENSRRVYEATLKRSTEYFGR